MGQLAAQAHLIRSAARLSAAAAAKVGQRQGVQAVRPTDGDSRSRLLSVQRLNLLFPSPLRTAS